jgi:hypothetical protein
MRIAFAALSFLVIGFSAAFADDLSGTWTGYWVKDHDPLPVTVTFANAGGSFTGKFDSDALQVADIPFSAVGDNSGNVHFELKGDQTTTEFDGTLAGNVIKGVFTEGARKGAFILDRATSPAPVFATRDVSFADNGTKLAGTLLLPTTPGKHPAILFLQGSGPEGRWANRWLAQKFVDAGFVALIFDKRGVGQSGGDWQKADFDALASDAVAGVRFLQIQPEVDTKLVGIYGHSQGGTIVPLVADDAGNLAFVIASAAGGLPPADVERYSIENNIGYSTLPADEKIAAKAYIDALIGAAYRGEDRTTLDALAEADKVQNWYFDPPPPESFYWNFSRRIASFDPSRAWRKVKTPVLLVYGLKDERVPPKQSAAAIGRALKVGHNDKVMVRYFPQADHTFTVVNPAKTGGWPQHQLDFASFLVNWARQQVRANPASPR